MKPKILPCNANQTDSLLDMVYPYPFPADDRFLVINAVLVFDYENGAKTTTVKEVAYTLVSEKLHSNFVLKVPGTTKLLVTADEIEQAAAEETPIYFELDPSLVTIRPYKFDAEARKYLLSIKCPESAITVV